MSHALLLALTLLAVPPAEAAGKIVKETLTTGGQQRSFYLFVPDAVVKQPAPLIVMLHGSGRDGRILLQHWQDLASKEGIILAGPDALKREQWGVATDGPELFHDLVEALKSKYPVDPRRVYLFGHSAGAIHSLHLGVLESEYFAAVAAHAGVFFEEFAPFASRAPRKIPMAIWVGTEDRLFPLPDVRGTHKALTGLGFPVELTEIDRHTHNYYRRASEINRQVWQFLQKHQLTGEPRYQPYEIDRVTAGSRPDGKWNISIFHFPFPPDARSVTPRAGP